MLQSSSRVKREDNFGRIKKISTKTDIMKFAATVVSNKQHTFLIFEKSQR